MRTRKFELLRPSEIVAEKERCPLAYVAFGPLEWHGPHLPLGTDPLRAYQIASRAADRTGGVVLPAVFFGTEREREPDMLEAIGFARDDYIVGMDFPANSMPSGYCRQEIFAIVVRQQLEMLVEYGYRLIAVVNGHGAANQLETINRLAIELNNEQGAARILTFFPNLKDESGWNNWGHADREEVSAMMHLYPESVDLDALPPSDERLKCTDFAVVDDQTFRCNPLPDHTVRDEEDPRLASSAEAGRQQTEEVVDYIVAEVKTALNELD